MWKVHVYRFIVGIDQAFNPLVYGGSEDVTISAQTAYNEILLGKSVKRRRALDWVFRRFGQENHCFWSLLVELDEFPLEREVLTAELAKRGIQ